MKGEYRANPYQGPPRDEIGYPRWPKSLDHEVTEEEIAAYVGEDPPGRAFLTPRLLRALVEIERANPSSRVGLLWKRRCAPK